jgi:hypothetical protein
LRWKTESDLEALALAAILEGITSSERPQLAFASEIMIPRSEARITFMIDKEAQTGYFGRKLVSELGLLHQPWQISSFYEWNILRDFKYS